VPFETAPSSQFIKPISNGPPSNPASPSSHQKASTLPGCHGFRYPVNLSSRKPWQHPVSRHCGKFAQIACHWQLAGIGIRYRSPVGNKIVVGADRRFVSSLAANATATARSSFIPRIGRTSIWPRSVLSSCKLRSCRRSSGSSSNSILPWTSRCFKFVKSLALVCAPKTEMPQLLLVLDLRPFLRDTKRPFHRKSRISPPPISWRSDRTNQRSRNSAG
jgi:hypothetical protein